MSTEFETIKAGLSEVKDSIKELTKTVTDNMVKQSKEIGVLQQWQSEVNNKLKKNEHEYEVMRNDLQKVSVKQENLCGRQETAFKRIDEIRLDSKDDESRLEEIESLLDKQKGATKMLCVIGSSICGFGTLLSIYAAFIKG